MVADVNLLLNHHEVRPFQVVSCAWIPTTHVAYINYASATPIGSSHQRPSKKYLTSWHLVTHGAIMAPLLESLDSQACTGPTVHATWQGVAFTYQIIVHKYLKQDRYIHILSHCHYRMFLTSHLTNFINYSSSSAFHMLRQILAWTTWWQQRCNYWDLRLGNRLNESLGVEPKVMEVWKMTFLSFRVIFRSGNR